jgi:hypothetical protein
MLRLDIKKEPYWLEMQADVRLKVKPLTSALMHMAQAAAVRRMLAVQAERKARLESGADASDLPDLEIDLVRNAMSATTLHSELAIHSIIAWENVFAPGTETPAELTPEHIAELMEIWFINQEFGRKYARQLDLLETEGNDSRPDANGTSVTGRDTAEDAEKKISPAAEESQAT